MTPDELALAHQRGKLEQSCPDCGRWEAASASCSKCFRAMGPADWYPNGDRTRRGVARQNAPREAQTPLKGGSDATDEHARPLTRFSRYGRLKMAAIDFLVGGASAGTSLTITGEGEQFVV